MVRDGTSLCAGLRNAPLSLGNSSKTYASDSLSRRVLGLDAGGRVGGLGRAWQTRFDGGADLRVDFLDGRRRIDLDDLVSFAVVVNNGHGGFNECTWL